MVFMLNHRSCVYSYICIDLALASNSLGTLHACLSLGQPVGYQYMEDLLHLDACHPTAKPSYSSVLGQVHSPLRWQEWDTPLSLYPDQRLRAYIVDGIRHSFHVGYNREAMCRSSRGNMKSTLENPHAISEYLRAECEAG